MKYIQKKISEAFRLKTFSPDFLIATECTCQSSQENNHFRDYVVVKAKQEMPSLQDSFILDTGNATEGFLKFSTTRENNTSVKSAKKTVEEGDVIVSRLRPYLRQVAYIPHGTFRLLNIRRLYCSTEFFVFSSNRPEISLAWAVYWLLSNDIQTRIQGATTGGHHPRFDVSLLLDSTIPSNLEFDSISKKIEKCAYEFMHLQYEMSHILSS